MAAASKAALQRLANDVRSELDLDGQSPFDFDRWSEEYSIPIISAAEVGASEAAVAHVTRLASHLWSAGLLQNGTGHIIVFNPAHSRVRVRSNLAHEVAHIIAEHVLGTTWLDEDGGCTGAGKVQEQEAAELAGALLIPPEAAKRAAMYGRAPETIARQFDVSVEMAEWRMRMSGGAVIAKRWRARSGR
ncbi:ImmA/IrrE family metallo-endopeptidase [Cellulosimicrobium cellulans]|uniref:ImmA/IrrE family metallo-endopeptidase n=1 Tax=Cellulosimicrobium cellulans TaxID=1710 RepID=UPI0021499B00|nr:ImmA/IrrE family metallo-endopeptidase [Cellulosimicrobium cellulans]